MTTADCLLFSYQRSSFLLHTMTDDLTPAEWLKRSVPGANPVAWIVGHLIVVERGALKALDLPMPPLPDEGFTARHSKGSKPTDATEYGDVTRLMPLWDEQRKILTDAIPKLPAETLGKSIEHPMFNNLGQLLALIPNHSMLHAGQISTIRRSLGKPAAF